MCAGTRRAKRPPQGNEEILALAMKEAVAICSELRFADEHALIAARNGVLRGMTITNHEGSERVREILRRIA